METRPLCGGNLLNQPFLKDYFLDIDTEAQVQFLHENGFFIGNNHMIADEELDKLEEILNEF